MAKDKLDRLEDRIQSCSDKLCDYVRENGNSQKLKRKSARIKKKIGKLAASE